MKNTVVLAFSGGVSSSAAIKWLSEFHEAQVVTVTVDLGQRENLVEVRDRALASGAARAHVLDARDEFMREFALPALKAGALAEGRYPMATAMGRPLIARKLVEIAHIENASRVAHAATGRDCNRIEMPIRTLDPLLQIITCADEWDAAGPVLAGHVSVPQLSAPPTGDRVDDNAWARTVGCRRDDASRPPAESSFRLTSPLDQTPDQAALVEIKFDRGTPIALNGVTMSLTEIVDSLATIAGEHGVGRLDRAKNRADGTRSRALYEAPAALVLHYARAELDRYVATEPLIRFSRSVSDAYVEVIDRGTWFDPLRAALDAYVASTQEHVSGTVRLALFKGTCRVAGRAVD